MEKKRIYDIPTRLFHWLFAGLFIFAFAIANLVDDESLIFSYHMLAGLILCFIVIWRIAWGFIGTSHARFCDFALQPKELLTYFRGIVSGDKRRWVGHNPASSWAALIMLFFALGLGVTGYLMSSGKEGPEELEDLHELLANGFLVLVILHITGVILHALRHRDGIWKSMFSGYKRGVPQEVVDVESRPVVGFVFLALTLGFSFYLFQNFEVASKKLKVFGSTLTLGEAEEEEHGSGERKRIRRSERHHEHDDD